MIALTDLSDVVYPRLGAAFAPPPGHQAAESKSRRHLTKRRARLQPSLVTEIVDDLTQREVSVHSMYDDEPIDILWPKLAGGGEYFVPELEPAYVIPHGERIGTVRTMDLALPARTTSGERQVDDFDRLELVRLIALLVFSLHQRELVTAGITWDTFAFTVEPRPRVVLHHPERVRRIGGEFLQVPAQPGPTGWSNSPFDSDRGDFAVLAFRLLVALETEACVEPDTIEGVIPGTSAGETAALIRLWERAAGPAGSRPQLVEWLEVLGLEAHA